MELFSLIGSEPLKSNPLVNSPCTRGRHYKTDNTKNAFLLMPLLGGTNARRYRGRRHTSPSGYLLHCIKHY